MIGKNDLEYFSRQAQGGCLNASEQKAVVDEFITAQRSLLELEDLLRELCLYLRGGTVRYASEVREWIADRLPSGI